MPLSGDRDLSFENAPRAFIGDFENMPFPFFEIARQARRGFTKEWNPVAVRAGYNHRMLRGLHPAHKQLNTALQRGIGFSVRLLVQKLIYFEGEASFLSQGLQRLRAPFFLGC